MKTFCLRALARRAQRHIKRQQMFIAGVGLRPAGALATVIQQCGDISGSSVFFQPVGKLLHVVRATAALGVSALKIAQIVGQVARANHQKALAGQRRQRAAHLPGQLRAAVADQRQRNHRHLGVRIHQPQRNPGAVVQPALGVLLHRQAGGAQGGGHFACGFAATAGRVADFI